MSLSYLVSTAGHAQAQNDQYPHDIRTILQLIEEGAEELQDEKVVGFTTLSEGGEWKCERLSYVELLNRSTAVAGALIARGIPLNESGQEKIVSLLCPTGLDFLLAWIALMRMGYGVVFVAPQCSSSAILHLYQSTSSTHLVHHDKYRAQAEECQRSYASVQLISLPSTASISAPTNDPPFVARPVDPASVSHVFHTSGTSGTPKPIPHTHERSVAVLPRRAIPSYLPSAAQQKTPHPPPSEPAAFTTTPLFHGGVSDLLRGWMARSVVYFYPTSDVSITAANVASAVDACRQLPSALPSLPRLEGPQLDERNQRFTPTAFLSVPYILSILAEDSNGPGMEMLQRMDYVSTGGAPLDSAIGNRMVEQGVRLVSRLGSSECGFLMSSHRDYATEKDWELLRNDSLYGDALVFEPQAERSAAGAERFEMIVTDRWTSKTKTNRDDGSYATGDLYERHPTKENVWRYVGRGDDVIVMSNGEKASPGPIETTLRSSPHLSDALVVGSDRPQLGVLLFPGHLPTPADLIDQLRDLITQANEASPSYAQIAPEMCHVVTDSDKISALPKSSKGTIQRGVANEVFSAEIAALYDGTSSSAATAGSVIKPKRSLEEIKTYVRDLINRVAGERRGKGDELEDETDLFGWGVDSLMATRIRTAAQKASLCFLQLSADLDVGDRPLPGNIVFDQPSIAKLSRYIYNRQEGIDENGDSVNTTYRLMRELAAKYGNFPSTSVPAGSSVASDSGSSRKRKTVLLTGATGSLGAFLLQRLSHEEAVGRVVCLVRAKDDAQAQSRVSTVLATRGLSAGKADITYFAADVTENHLGLSTDQYDGLASSIDIVIHAAWPVHFVSSLVSFEDQVRGTRNLLDLTLSRPACQFFFCSSIASVLGGSSTDSDPLVREEWSDDPATASPIGYSQSKWVTEQVCQKAGSGRATVLRIGQLCGDGGDGDGYWNEKEGWPLMIRTAQTTGSLPALDERPSWLPVDTAARAISDIVLGSPAGETQPVYHIVHPKPFDWAIVLDGLRAAGVDFDTVTTSEWLDRVGQSVEQNEEDPSGQMLSMWQSAYGQRDAALAPAPAPTVSSARAQAASPTLKTAPDIDSKQIERMVKAWRRSGFLT